MTNHYWDRVTAPHADRDRTAPPTDRDAASEPWPVIEDASLPPGMYGVIGDFSQIVATDRDADNVPSEPMALRSLYEFKRRADKAEATIARVEALRDSLRPNGVFAGLLDVALRGPGPTEDET